MALASEKKVAVIGAGAAGICAAKHLATAGQEVIIFEMGSKIGGLWVYENDNGMSPAYKSLHVNSENKVTAYQDFPFKQSAPIYPDHSQMVEYLNDYANHFGITQLIRFNSVVTSVIPDQDNRWRVSLSDGTETIFDAVVVATGHQGVPKHPSFSKDFTGEYLHSQNYRVPDPFKDKDILVVGIGNSACDIASDVCQAAKSVTIAVRSPVLLMPRMFLGVPTSRVLGKLEKPWMPWMLKRWLRTWISRIAFGTMEQWGLRTPKTRTHPAGHHLLMGHMIWERIKAKPGIKNVRGQEVYFEDGSSQKFDVMIAATGYSISLPFLSSENSPITPPYLDLFHRVVSPKHKGLYFVGFFNVSGGGNIRMMDDQAEWVTELITQKQSLPNQSVMAQAIQAERDYIQKYYPASERYGLELDPAKYRSELLKQRMNSKKVML